MTTYDTPVVVVDDLEIEQHPGPAAVVHDDPLVLASGGAPAEPPPQGGRQDLQATPGHGPQQGVGV